MLRYIIKRNETKQTNILEIFLVCGSLDPGRLKVRIYCFPKKIMSFKNPLCHDYPLNVTFKKRPKCMMSQIVGEL